MQITKIIFTTIILTLSYFAWSQTTDITNLTIMALIALVISVLFRRYIFEPILSPKKIIFAVYYVFFLFFEIIKSNLDVARRVIMPVIPINPGIVKVKTKLKSPMGRLLLSSSITLTPGTLTVDIDGDTLYIHWIDVKDKEESGATEKIVSNFEKYLEVIFG